MVSRAVVAPVVLDMAATLLRERTGLVFPPVRRSALAEGLNRAMRRAGTADLLTYLQRLAGETALLDDLVTEVTVGETHFFRAPEQFAAIQERVLAPWLTRGAGTLRVWSAGCASGEEPYTMAILLHQLGLGGRAHILGTDISRTALAKARRGRYTRWSLRGVATDVERAYFRPRNAELELLPEVRRAVEFRYLNLVVDSYPSAATGVYGMDLVLCRNVLMYFDADTVAHVARRLLDSLSPSGWLVLGASDPMVADTVPCETVLTSAGLAYRRGEPRLVTPVLPARTEPVPAPPVFVEPPMRPPAPPALDAAKPDAASTPEDPEQAAEAYRARDYARAAALAGGAVRRAPEDLTGWVVLTRALANRGLLAEAGAACATALDRHRLAAELHYLHAVLLGEAGRIEESATAAGRALYLEPTLVVAHLALASALARSGETAGARRAAQNACHLLSAMPAEARVRAADGETAAQLLQMAAVQLALLGEAAA